MRPIIYLLSCLCLLLWACQSSSSPANNPSRPVPAQVSLHYSRHALCRMDCRHITDKEIREVLTRGIVNEHSTEAHEGDAGKCPKYALEANTDEGQHLRVVFAYCGSENEATVVTCIDLDNEWHCDCR